ncbi:MAG: hypothetical protein GEV28_33755 [Actinophytocola sp.]|uniref:acyl carrier protein n=1 Tax=Actinophytocola sp. TaxID=1872138 RepID=UPI0013297DC2|nr:acyl carrier protein [Actinophytocola sp.]MPZ85087.1 hypothetical protein [Actinophytocola sp.]
MTEPSNVVRLPAITLAGRLRRVVHESVGVPESMITDTASLDDEIGVDSLTLVSLQVNIETEFRISLSVADLLAADRFDRILELIEDRVADRRAA